MKQIISFEELKQHRKIEIGISPYTNEDAYFYDYNLGDAYLVVGMTGYGKSILAGNLAVELAQHRPLIIFDYNGAYRNLRYVNLRNKHNRFKAIPNLLYLHRFGFKLQDFTSPFDWLMLGMTQNGANICAAKASMVNYHQNDFNIFRRLIEEVQVYGKGTSNAEAWRSTKNSILSKLNTIKSCFVDNKAVDITDTPRELIRYKGTPFYVSDWVKFAQKHRHICLNMNSEMNAGKAQLFAGKIMNELQLHLQRINPVILVEEAHKLCPASVENESIVYSRYEILRYLKEYHKKGVKLILITQSPEQLPEETKDEIKRFFIGKLQNIRGNTKMDDMFRMSSALEYSFGNDYREFWIYSPLYNEKAIFVPYDSYTYYEKRI